MTKEQAIALLTPLFVAFNEKNSERLGVYAEILKDKPTALLKQSVITCISKCKFMPSVAEILETMRSLTNTEQGENNPDKDWAEAKAIIMRELNRCAGAVGRTPNFETQAIELAVRSYGWQELCELRTDNFNTAMAQLRDIYFATKKRIETNKRNNAIKNKMGGNTPMLDSDNIPRIDY